jgi:hypothetical protein
MMTKKKLTPFFAWISGMLGFGGEIPHPNAVAQRLNNEQPAHKCVNCVFSLCAKGTLSKNRNANTRARALKRALATNLHFPFAIAHSEKVRALLATRSPGASHHALPLRTRKTIGRGPHPSARRLMQLTKRRARCDTFGGARAHAAQTRAYIKRKIMSRLISRLQGAII